jgi:hypothetical protein
MSVPKSKNKASITHFEERLKQARNQLARAKKELQLQSMRERSRRERDVGKIVLRLIENCEMDPQVVARLRDEVRSACRSPAQVAAFRDTPFGD